MTPTAEQLLQQGLNELNVKVDRLTAALIGSDFAEGRIPRLESAMKDHGRRIGTLERFYWKLAGAFGLGLLLLEAAIHFIPHR
jgi:hypothetical protein